MVWLGREWGSLARGLQPASDALLGLACLALAAAIVASSIHRRRRDLHSLSRRTLWTLAAILVICGFLQLAEAIFAVAWDRMAGMSLLAAGACWAGAAALRNSSARARGPQTGDLAPAVAATPQPRDEHQHVEPELRQLAEADARRNTFLAMLGHELRNPLAPIRNALRIMKRRGSDDPEVCWARDVIEHQLQQLHQLVDDLQELSRVTSGKLRLDTEPVDVATIVAYAVETSRPTIDAHHHRLSISLPASPVLVEADSIRMAQVISNLLNNAAKYTEAGGQIRLGVAVEGAEAVFRVRDNGIGISAEMASRIFDLFAQVDHALDRSQGGLGLGLALVRSLVEMHGGSVQARSDGPGRGSEFIVRLLVLPPERAQTELESKPTTPALERAFAPDGQPSAPARRVLVVDDNTSAAESLALILKFEGYDVRTAYDGESALEGIRTFRPRAVLLDIGLPGISGHEVARRVREDAGQTGVALLVAITGYAETEARHRSREAGFDHHLVKPVDPEDVLALLAPLEWHAESLAPHA
jgi:signal transduction histidine kinase/CheY-like chemotaxis protein